MSDQEPFDITQWGAPLPHDDDAIGGVAPVAPMVLGDSGFPYVGKALTLAEFDAYLASYDFGPIAPDWPLIHHTAIPTVAQWTAYEVGLMRDQIKAKRLKQVTAIKNYYQNTKHWSAGPHLFVDDLYVYLMTPMANIGIHAGDGNSTKINGNLHYSIGLEVVGDYTTVRWSPNTALMVAGVVARLLKRLKNFKLVDGRAPGTVDSHRNHGKPACPGDAIQPAYYLPLFQKAYDALTVTHYTVRATAANVRQGATTRQQPVQVLPKGAPWSGSVVRGTKETVPGFGTSDEWVCNNGLCVFRPLLEEQK
jgi:hypothetical protein